jgi:hypothetical protein
MWRLSALGTLTRGSRLGSPRFPHLLSVLFITRKEKQQDINLESIMDLFKIDCEFNGSSKENMTVIQREIEQECVPFWRYFKDPAKQRDYVQYRRQSLEHSTAFSVFLGFATLGMVIILLKDSSCMSKYLLQPNEALCRIRIISCALIRQPAIWSLAVSSLCGCDLNAVYEWLLKKLGLKCLVGYTFYADVVIIVTSLTLSLMILAKVASGACPNHPHDFTLRNVYCNPGASLGYLPQELMLLQVIGLSFFHVALKGSSWFVILLSFAMEVVGTSAATFIVKGKLFDATVVLPFLWKVY